MSARGVGRTVTTDRLNGPPVAARSPSLSQPRQLLVGRVECMVCDVEPVRITMFCGVDEDSELELFSLHQHALKCEGFTTCFS